jgi:hypothetical protein
LTVPRQPTPDNKDHEADHHIQAGR